MKTIIIVLTLILFLSGCENSVLNPDLDPVQEYIYQQPVIRNDGLEISDLKTENIDESQITRLIRDINSGSFPKLEGIAIFRNGFLVLEEYFSPSSNSLLNADSQWERLEHSMASCTKSITSTLIGIAFKKGLIKNLDEKLFDYFPEYHDLNWDNGKREINIENLLTMRAGMYWDETSFAYTDSRNTHYQLDRSGDILKYCLELAMINKPGEIFDYNSALPILLGSIIKKCSGFDADEFAKINLFDPLGITNFEWIRYPDGTVHMGGGLSLSIRDRGKIGLLYLNNGEWNGQKIIDPSWIDSSLQAAPTIWPGVNYGFLWWIKKFGNEKNAQDAFYADGYGQQYIICIPNINMVIVISGSNYIGRTRFDESILSNYILPAVL